MENNHPNAKSLPRDLSKRWLPPHYWKIWNATAFEPFKALSPDPPGVPLPRPDALDRRRYMPLRTQSSIGWRPMYNFSRSPPPLLKAWINQLVRMGKTILLWSAGGPPGAAGNKSLIVHHARGGGALRKGKLRQKRFDFQVNLICATLGFIGLTDVELN